MTSHMDFSTGDAPLPDIVILTHKLVRDYQLGTETVKALHGVDIQIQRRVRPPPSRGLHLHRRALPGRATA